MSLSSSHAGLTLPPVFALPRPPFSVASPPGSWAVGSVGRNNSPSLCWGSREITLFSKACSNSPSPCEKRRSSLGIHEFADGTYSVSGIKLPKGISPLDRRFGILPHSLRKKATGSRFYLPATTIRVRRSIRKYSLVNFLRVSLTAHALRISARESKRGPQTANYKRVNARSSSTHALYQAGSKSICSAMAKSSDRIGH